MADVGCGSGEIAVILSRAVGPSGRVYADDIRKDAVSQTKKNAKKHKARNVTVVSVMQSIRNLRPASWMQFSCSTCITNWKSTRTC